MISTNQIAYFTQWSIFEVDENHLAYFQSYKSNDWLVNIISTEHDELWGVFRSSMR